MVLFALMVENIGNRLDEVKDMRGSERSRGTHFRGFSDREAVGGKNVPKHRGISPSPDRFSHHMLQHHGRILGDINPSASVVTEPGAGMHVVVGPANPG